MKNFLSIRTTLCTAIATVSMTASAQNVTVESGSYSPTWESVQSWQCPEWFKNAKFGIWAHWGPQCQAEDGDWYARDMYFKGDGQYNWHVQHYGDPSVFGFKDLCNAWKADKWDPDSLVKLYKSVGARYFFTLGQHHDNFDLWDSPYQEWNSVRVGPKKDIVKGWSDACKKYNIPLGVSMHGSHTWTWMEMSQKYDGNLTKEDGYKLNADGTEKWWKGLDPQELYAQKHTPSANYENIGTIHSQWNWGNGASQPSDAYKQKFQNRVLECINDYNPAMLYFDDTVLPFYGCDESVGLNILSDFYNHSANKNNGVANVVVMGKQLDDSQKNALLWDVERGIPDRTQSKYWQTCTCIGSWHYDQNIYNNNGYKSAQQVVDMLVDIVSKNGNLLLSVPIKGNGTIDDKELKVLEGIKAWMDANSVSIYGTRPWKTFGEGPLADAANPLTAQGFNESNNYTSEDVRFAQRNDTLFATVMRWPSDTSYTIKSLGYTSDYYNGKVKEVKLLGYGPVSSSMDIDGLKVTLPKQKCNEIAPVFQITFDTNASDTITLQQMINIYQQKISTMKTQVSCNTGKMSITKLNEFISQVETALQYVNASKETQQSELKLLKSGYESLQNDGYNQGGAPNAEGSTDITTQTLIESSNFSRTSETNTGTRFGSPLNWAVNNFRIPNGNSGTKNGIDNYPGYSCLSMGIWDDKQNNQEGNLSNARIYRKVHLQPGRYYLGAQYNTTYNISSKGYLFAATDTMNTGDIPTQSVAYYAINHAGENDGLWHGLYFTLNQEQDLILGFQVDLTNGANEQEFRAKSVELLYYGEITYSKVQELVQTITDTLKYCKINNNTGYYSQAAYDKLTAALNTAKALTSSSSSEDINITYTNLNDTYTDFLKNGKNKCGQPEADGATDITASDLVEASKFSRTDNTVTSRFASPKNWTVENFMIPNGSDGVKNGLDKYPGYDCLMLGIWNDRSNNQKGDISNARIYRTVHLEAGTYYFGAIYNTINSLYSAYIFACDTLLNTDKINNLSIAYAPISEAAANGKFYGINFTLDKAADVKLGFQTDLSKGSNTQEFRVVNVALYNYSTTVGISEPTRNGNLSPATDTRYYSIIGMPLQRAPQHGLYIIRQGNKVTKVNRK
jgi:alpha-L-fucosidase